KKSGQPLALLANYGLHYVGGIPRNKLSADYFGEFAVQVREQLQGDDSFVGILSNGASGDVNNYRFRDPLPPSPRFERVRVVADKIARIAANVSREEQYTDQVELGMIEQKLDLQIRKPDAAELARCRAVFEAAAD